MRNYTSKDGQFQKQENVLSFKDNLEELRSSGVEQVHFYRKHKPKIGMTITIII